MTLIPLSKEQYKGYKLQFQYTTDSYFDVEVKEDDNEIISKFIKRPFPKLQTKQFTDKMFEDHWEHPSAYGYFIEERLIGVLEVSEERWSNRLRITNILVEEEYRRQGIGIKLMNQAKTIAKTLQVRAIILETQTCNTKAISFYQNQGFVFGGFDRSCYSNNDIKKNEVRIEMVYFLN